MSQSSATILYEDNYGFMWAGTQNGLNKYDGTDFEIFEQSLDGKTGLTDAYIQSLYEDDSYMYIGTGQGLSIYDHTLKQVRPYNFNKSAKEIDSKIICSIAKTENTLWLGTYAHGLYAYQTETGKLRQFLANEELVIKRNSNNHIIKVAALSGGRLLVVSSLTIYVIDENLNILNHTPINANAICVSQFDTTNFAIGTDDGSVIELNVSPSSKITVKSTTISPGFNILCLAKSENNTIWVGTENNGIFIYEKASEKIKHLRYSSARPESIPSNSIWSLLSARNGVMWMAPFRNGLSFYDSKYYKFKQFNTDPFDSASLNNRLVNCFEEDSTGNIWIGTDGGGLNFWDRSTNTFDHFWLENKNFGTNVILSLLQASENELWAGSWGNGITVFNMQDKTFYQKNTKNSFLKSDYISDLMLDKDGNIWIINFYGGVQVYSPITDSYTDITLESAYDGSKISSAYTILQDNAGNIWIGSLGVGLFRLQEVNGDYKVDHFHNIDGNGTLSNNFVNTIAQDEWGTIWVGTQGGLNQYHGKTNSFTAITKADKLKNHDVRSILADTDNFLWLGTEHGISKYNISTGATLNYGMEDGLQSNEFNPNSVLKTEAGEFVFGGSNGFNIFRPEDIIKRDDNPKLFISELKIFNKPVLPNDEFAVMEKDISQVNSITLDYDQSVLNFNFKALTYRHPEKVSYAYFLENFEKGWNYVGNQPNATYTNLNPGNYNLRIKSTNSDGIWKDNEINLALIINPPIWQTWWFRSLLIIGILGFMFLIYKLRVRNIKKDKVELEYQVSERTQELQAQKKKLAQVADELSAKNEEIQRFTYAVSHDLKSPLNSIEVMAGMVATDVETGNIEDVKQSLEYIDQSCKLMTDLIADITEIARLGEIKNRMEILETKDIIEVARSMAIGRFVEKGVELVVADELPNIYGDRNRLIQVFENLIDNAIKYMGNQEEPLIEIKASITEGVQKFFIIDNGSGIDAESLKKMFVPFKRFHTNTTGVGLGLYMIKKIVLSHGGHIIAESKGKGMGTTFVLTLPNAEIEAQKAQTENANITV